MQALHAEGLVHRRNRVSWVMLFGIVLASAANAQAARVQASSTIVFDVYHVDIHSAQGCTAVVHYSAAPADSVATAAANPLVEDSLDTSDDTIDPAAMVPGSGMVLVDSHGRTISPPNTTAGSSPEKGCCPLPQGLYTGTPIDVRAYGDQTASSGSPARAACDDAMNPPPSSRSPL